MSRYIPVTEYFRKKRWCNQNGWTDPFYQDGSWYAFPPRAVIPQEIPMKIWEKIAIVSRTIVLVALGLFACCLFFIAIKVIVESAIHLLPAFIFIGVYEFFLSQR